ncbi:MAG: histidine phosphatase family protein [Microbacteriaceae bacterium]
MTLLYLVRHGETDWNLARRIQGSTDIPLNATGRAQARRAGRLLARRQWDGIMASPLSRALETASIIAEEVGLPAPSTIDALVERAYGAAEGLTEQTLAERYPGRTAVPGRESRADVAGRVIPALAMLAEAHPGQSLILVSHGGVIRTLLNSVASDNPQHRGVPITNGSIHSFRHVDGGFELIAFDDPIEVASIRRGSADIEEQNAVERRDSLGEG